MIIRLLVAAALLAPLVLPVAASATVPRHHRHHAARVSTATFRTPLTSKPSRELRASRHLHDGVVQARYAAGHRHALSRGS